MRIEIVPRDGRGGTEFIPEPSRLHLGGQQAEGVDKLEFSIPAEWDDKDVSLYIEHADGIQQTPVQLDGENTAPVDRKITSSTSGRWMLVATDGLGYTAYTKPGTYDVYGTLATDGAGEDPSPSLYEQFVARVLESANIAQAAAKSAGQSSQEAATSAKSAAGSASQASGSAAAAAESEAAAKASADRAAASEPAGAAERAEAAATRAETAQAAAAASAESVAGAEATTAKDAGRAEEAATRAEVAQKAAAASAESVAGAEAATAKDAGRAEAAAEAAEAAKTAAAGSASAAAGSAETAVSSKDQAGTFASQAQAAKNAAAASESAASDSQEAAERSSSEAAASAQAAETAKTAAETSASEAAQSAQEAEAALNALDIEAIKATLTPPGTVQYFAQATPPEGWLACNGAAVSRSAYAALFGAIGTTYGAGDGSTTFALPDLRDRVAWGGTAVGTVKTAGLPNIEGSFRALAKDGTAYESGAIWKASESYGTIEEPGPGEIGSTEGYSKQFFFSAHNSNGLYGGSDTVQPPALTLLPCIKY